MDNFTSVYQSELPHRAKSVFMYLHDRLIRVVNVIRQLVPLPKS